MDNFSIDLPVIERYLSSNFRLEIEKISPLELREILEKFARYFKKEFKYDHIQYEANEHLFADHKYHGYLFTEPAFDALTEAHIETPTRIIGGCCFRLRQYDNEPCWVLDWVWIHPFFRHRGKLKKHWKFFLEKFGEFRIEHPLSNDMKMFLTSLESKKT